MLLGALRCRMIYDIFKFIFILLEVVLIFNLMILVHELGHFLAARWRGLVVEKFAIWFGKPIWKKTINGVEYRLGTIPAGGFVAIPQLAPMEIMEGEVETDRSKLPPVKPIDKIIVAAAGPLFSFLLAAIFACIVWAVGRPIGEAEKNTVIGYVAKDGPAAKAGLQAGDKILSVNGAKVSQFSPAGNGRGSIVWNVIRSEAPLIPITYERDGAVHTVDVEPKIAPREGWGRSNLRAIEILPAATPRIARVPASSPEAAAGFEAGDYIVKADG
ncbi:MAG: site-2 protease family protein, partial [Chthoniobacterales bacterium]